MTQKNLAIWLLRIGIASVFVYAAGASFLEPGNWIGYLPIQLRHLFPADKLLIIFSVFELSLSAWILSGKKAFYSSLFAGLSLIGIILTNLGALDITFRDIAIVFACFALAALSREK